MNYIGSKRSLLSYIDEVLEDFVRPKSQMLFCDIFGGTGIVGTFFKLKGFNIIANDIQYYSYITMKHFIENNEPITFDKLSKYSIEPFEYLNNIDGIQGFIYKNYSLGGTSNQEYQRQYFSDDNAMKIDAMRLKIEEWKNQQLVSDSEYAYLIASLLESADKVANTASVYEAFLKHLKVSAQKSLILKPVEVIVNKNCNMLRVYNEDCNALIQKIKGDILYIDPPYNTRRYDTNYHILETIALYDSPKIKGKTGIRDEGNKKSMFCTKKNATQALEDLISNANFKYIMLSYNDEGIIPIEEIERIMSKYGRYQRYEHSNRRSMADRNRENKKDTTIEYIHCLEKYE